MRRSVAITMSVCRPAALGLTMTCTCLLVPLPLVVSPMTQRTMSPPEIALNCSPGCKAMSLTISGAA